MTLRNIEYKKRNEIISAAATASTADFTHVSHSVKDQNKHPTTAWTSGLERQALEPGYDREEEVRVTSVVHHVPWTRCRAGQQSHHLGSKKK